MNSRKFRAAVSALAFLFLIGHLIAMPIRSLPDISALEQIYRGDSAVQIQNLNGKEIYTYHSPTYGQKTQISLNQVSDELIAMTIVTEDRTFFTNPGFSPTSIIRAIFQNLMLRKTYSGASTITQQVVKNILLSPEERYARSIRRKAKEIILAAAVTLRYDKETILSVYLNEIYYGQNATGVEQAAQTYFGKHASDIDLYEAAFIAGLPQAPNYYGSDTAAGEKRQQEVLRALERNIREEHCIPLSSGNSPQEYCPDPDLLPHIGN